MKPTTPSKDTQTQSLLRGRNGAAVLAMASAALTAYGVTAEQQQQAYQVASMSAAAVSAGLALYSKWKEGR